MTRFSVLLYYMYIVKYHSESVQVFQGKDGRLCFPISRKKQKLCR